MPTTGEMTEQVWVQQESRTPNGQGGYSTSWSNLGPKEWAEITGMSGDEALLAGVQRGVTQWRVTIRRRGEVKPKHRLLWDGLVLDIKSAIPSPRDPRSYMVLICESGAVS